MFMVTPMLKSNAGDQKDARKEICDGCLVRIEKSVPQDRYLASVGKAWWCKQWPLEGFFYPHLTPMKDSYM